MIQEWHSEGKEIKPLLKELVDYKKRVWEMRGEKSKEIKMLLVFSVWIKREECMICNGKSKEEQIKEMICDLVIDFNGYFVKKIKI